MDFSSLFGDLASVTVAGLILGAGIPVLFGIGIRLSAPQEGVEGHPSHTVPGWSRALAGLIFLVIIAAIVVGLLWITQGRLYESFGIDLFGTGGSSEG